MAKLNKPKVDFIKENRKKRQAKKKQSGVAVKAEKARLAVSAVRTKKHARKVAHRERMLAKMKEEDEKKRQQAEAAEAAKAQEADVKMDKPRQKKAKGKKGGAEAMQE